MVLERLLYPCASGLSPDLHERNEVMQVLILKVFERQGVNPPVTWPISPALFSGLRLCEARMGWGEWRGILSVPVQAPLPPSPTAFHQRLWRRGVQGGDTHHLP